MLFNHRICSAILCLGLAACAPAPRVVKDGPLPGVQMLFAAPPQRLFTAVPAVCDGPDERVLRPKPGLIECRRLLPPKGAAGAILMYDGTVEDLPESVIRFATRSVEGGHVVTANAFVAVPQRDGTTVAVAFPDPKLDRKMVQMLTKLGGTPYP